MGVEDRPTIFINSKKDVSQAFRVDLGIINNLIDMERVNTERNLPNRTSHASIGIHMRVGVHQYL